MDKIKDLMAEAVENRLEAALNGGESENNNSFKEAMDATDRYIELRKLEDAANERQRESEDAKVAADKDRWLRGVEIGVPVLLFVGDVIAKNSFATRICGFEKDYTFTTSAGRSIGQFFKWKR